MRDPEYDWDDEEDFPAPGAGTGEYTWAAFLIIISVALMAALHHFGVI